MTPAPVRVSVVTPFHNTAAYLAECIESVLSQSFRDFEYILVDNQSTDNSLAIARSYAARDSRIRVIETDRLLSQVQNYNAALTHIAPHSVYCKIVQADDALYKGCLAEMVALADTDAGIGIVSSYRLAGRQVKEVGLPRESRVIEGRDICRDQLLESRHFFGSPSTLLIRSEIVRSRQPFYEEGRLHEDTEACYDILQRWKFGFIHQVLSFTRTDNDSIMSRARQFNPHLLDRLIVVRRFGPVYLSPLEFDACWRDVETRYLGFLAEAKLRRRDVAFWDYHRHGQASVGYQPGRSKLMLHGVLVLADLVLNPKNTVSRMLRRMRGGRASEATR